MKKVNCETCNKEFSITPSRAKKNKRHTCSKECMGKLTSLLNSKRIKTNCDSCGKEIFYKKSHFKNRKYHICSHDCHAKIKSQSIRGDSNPKALKLGTKERIFWDRYIDYKSRSSIRGLEFDLTDDFLLKLYDDQNGLCYYTGYPLKLDGDISFDTMSLDRVDSSKGYIKGNVVFCLNCINRMKGDADLPKIYEVFEYIAKRYGVEK